jgi:peptidyl-prolyl cis-trans isomerase SurA
LSVPCAPTSRWSAVFVPVLVLAFATLTRLTIPCLASAAETQVEAIVAQVGNEVILLSEVMELAAPVEERMRQAGAPQIEIVRVRQDALERLIETRLVSSVVERLELGADRDEVDAAISAIASDNGISVEQLLRSIVSHGLRVEEYRAKIQDEIERSKVINTMVRSRVQITDEEVETLYVEQFGEQYTGGEEFHLRHIIVSPEGPHADSADAACQLVRETRIRIQSGEVAFSEMATNVSDMNADRGGDLGWMHRKDLATWMADSIEDLDSGELSEVIEMPFGCNLLEVVDRRPFERIELEDAKAQLQNIVFQRKTEVEYTKWLDELREHTYIERKSGFGG